MKTVIMAGGKGTRIASIAPDIPKPLVDICGKPILEREIECLKRQGFDDIILTVGYMSSKIIDYFGDGSNFGVKIDYFVENEPLGNAGALFKIKDKLSDNFLLINADSLFDIDLNRFIEYHYSHHGIATLFAHPNSHPYDSGLLLLDDNNCVTSWISKEETHPKYYRNLVNAGIHVLSHRVLEQEIDKDKIDLDRDVLKPIVNTGQIYAYISPEYVRDMGTVDRYYKVCDDFKNNTVSAKNLNNKQRAVFLDRDGTINKYVGFLTQIDDFELINQSAEAIKKINDSGYLAIVVTNQPVVARGEVTVNELNEIHKKLETMLGAQGAYIDGLYYCPHHPDSGYDGEISELKIDCDCRKPKPGMLLRAATDFNIDLSQSYMIGDSDNDIQAGINAGCKTVRIGMNGINSLYDAVNNIL